MLVLSSYRHGEARKWEYILGHQRRQKPRSIQDVSRRNDEGWPDVLSGGKVLRNIKMGRKNDDSNESLVRVRRVTFHSCTTKGGIVLLPYQILSFLHLDSPPRDRTITSFLFSFNYRCQGVVAVCPLGSSSQCSAHFFPFSTDLYYSFIYSNYLRDVNLSLPLISRLIHVDFPLDENVFRSISDSWII